MAGSQTNRESLPCCCCSVLGGHAIAGLSTEEFIALLLRSSLHHVRIFFRLVLSHCSWSLRIAPPTPHMPLPCSQLRCLPALDDIAIPI